MAAFSATILLSFQSLEIYKTRNTIAAIENNHYYWNTTFPSFTLCPVRDRIDRVRSDKFCRENGIHDMRDQTEFFQFIESLANATYETFGQIKDFKSIEVILFQELNIDETLNSYNLKSHNAL